MQESINNQSMLKVGTILHDTYRIDSYLSSGGFGNTYVATNVEFEERVAIKEFFIKGVTQRDENQATVSVSNAENSNRFLEQKEKFKKEARRIRQLKNEHIISVHDLFEEKGTAYYVMDYVDGENLAERLKRTSKPMSEQEVCTILPQILDALKAVHDAGIWHLDLKPANIMLDKTNNIKIIDFGASKQLNAQKGGATTSTAISYTNGYAPREQMEQNYDKFGPWTDIYALGATLYNLLTNKRPPLPTDIDDDITADKHEILPFPNSVSKETKALVLMMLSTNRLKRPQTIDSIIDAEKSRKTTSQQSFSQQTTSIDTSVNDDEETLIATSHRAVKEEKAEPKATPKPGPKAEHKQTEQYSDSSSYNSNDGDGLSKNTIIFIVTAVIIVVCIFLNYGSCRNDSTSTTESTPISSETTIQTVNQMQYSTAIGGCQYSGPVDAQGVPNGLGEAFFNDGRYYKGNFEHGVLNGDDVYFKYSNGDEFKGKFRNNSFYYGTYTIAEDGSYFTGSYKNGQPDGGTWYNKNGKVIQ
jgi:serine/threonine-protein kinase